MREAFIPINDVITHIMTWGPWIEESFVRKEVVICITGNPGLVGYYTHFLGTVHEQLGDDIPIWIIGHAGHDEPPSDSLRKVPPLKGNESIYTLDGQVKHKLAFIRKYVPEDVKIHLIGHSIGTWMALEMLKEPDIQAKVQHAYLLFPTIERMLETNPGKMLTHFVLPLWSFLRLFIILFNAFPLALQAFLISAYFYLAAIPRVYVGTTVKYLRLSILTQILFLAEDEMKVVRTADIATITANRDRLKLYYGKTDGWTPAQYLAQLRDRVPGIDATMDVYGITHAFVLKNSVKMGKLVAGWIQERRI